MIDVGPIKRGISQIELPPAKGRSSKNLVKKKAEDGDLSQIDESEEDDDIKTVMQTVRRE